MSYQRVPLSDFNDLVPLVYEEAHLYEIRELVQAGILSSVKSVPQPNYRSPYFFYNCTLVIRRDRRTLTVTYIHCIAAHHPEF